MRVQRGYLDSTSHVTAEGRLCSAQDEAETPSIPEASASQVAEFNQFLEKYQEDINKIVGKYRGAKHHLSHEEIVSEVNLSFVKKRDELIFRCDGDFSSTEFRKLAFAFVRNVTRWSFGRVGKQAYVKRRNDFCYTTEDGPKTSFELAITTDGEEDPFYEDFDRNSKCEHIVDVLKHYSGLLTDGELKVFSMMQKGMDQYEISTALGITRQAVSVAWIKISEKIRNYVPKEALYDHSYEKVTKGHDSIRDFFAPPDDYIPLESQDRESLRDFLLKNAQGYTSGEVAKKFLNGKYTKQQIVAFCCKNKLAFCLKKARRSKYTPTEEKRLIKLFKEGKSYAEIAEITNSSVDSVRGKRGRLTFTGVLPPVDNWPTPNLE